MNLFHTVLFATDFSEPSREAFRIACAMLEGDRAGRLIVLHIVEQTYLMEESIGFGELGVPMTHPAVAAKLAQDPFVDVVQLRHGLQIRHSHAANRKPIAPPAP